MGESAPPGPAVTSRPPAFAEPHAKGSGAATDEDFLFHLYRGIELLQDNRVHEAKDELEQALTLQPRDAKGQDLLAVVYFRIGLFPRAIQIYEDLKTVNPADASVRVNLALCYLKTGQTAEAKRELEEVTRVHPSHRRAWGYLGLAYERLGDLEQARHAFERGGHALMARRVADRRGLDAGLDPAAATEIRGAAALAFEELDAGDIHFAVDTGAAAEPQGTWLAFEPGRPMLAAEARPAAPALSMDTAVATVSARPMSNAPEASEESLASRSPHSDPLVLAALANPLRPAGTATPSFGSPFVRPSTTGSVEPGSPVSLPASTKASGPGASTPTHAGPTTPAPPRHVPRKTIPIGLDSSLRAVERESPASERPRGVGTLKDLVREAQFGPLRQSTITLRHGAAHLRVTPGGPFIVRVDAVRTYGGSLESVVVERRARGRSTGEALGGVAAPLVRMQGDGMLVVAPRRAFQLVAFRIQDEAIFVREEHLLGFEVAEVLPDPEARGLPSRGIWFDNGRLALGEGEHASIVQLRGTGAVLFELIATLVAVPVSEGSLSVRRDALVGWTGRLVPRAISPAEAPHGQRGIVSLAGEGTILLVP